MMITQREAVRALRARVSSDEQARILLRAGVCGVGRRSGGVLLYEEIRVAALVGRHSVDVDELRNICPQGVYVGRLPRTIKLDVTLGWDRVSAQVCGCPPMPWLTSGLLGVSITAADGGLPWLATLCGLVVHGAELTGFTESNGAPGQFALRPPGDWFQTVDRCWLPTSRGGRSWRIWQPL